MAKSFDKLVKRTTTRRTQVRAARRTQQLLAELLLSEVRQLAGKSQQQVAEALGIKQPSLSKLEKQADMQISTLRKIVKALGGELEVLAVPEGNGKDRSIRHYTPGRGIMCRRRTSVDLRVAAATGPSRDETRRHAVRCKLRILRKISMFGGGHLSLSDAASGASARCQS